MLPLQPTDSRFPLPDWTTVHSSLPEGMTPTELDAFWTGQGREWIHLLKDSLGEGYQGYESPNFWLVSREPADACRRLIGWAEATAKKVSALLKVDHTGRLFGKCPFLVLHDLDTYYEYFAAYVPDGSYAGSGGVYLNHGYGHFVFSFLDMSQAEAVLAHELTHAYVAHLPIPAWLNEGVAQLCEISLTGRDHTRYDEIKDSIDAYWNEDTIQAFWDGSAFLRDHDSQMHSYHLAKVLTSRLSRQRSGFHDFLHSAHRDDAGAAALAATWGYTLSGLVADYLGEGNWTPRLPLQTDFDKNREPDTC
jgi:hypothetical protein